MQTFEDINERMGNDRSSKQALQGATYKRDLQAKSRKKRTIV